MAGVERRGVTVGRNEPEPFANIVLLANVMWPGSRHWNEGFQTPDWRLRLQRRIGGDTLRRLRGFERTLKMHREASLTHPVDHIVEVLPRDSKIDLRRKPFAIDGIPFVLLNPGNNIVLDALLHREIVDDIVLAREKVEVDDLAKDIVFLNEYFGLGLHLQRWWANEWEFKIPSTTKIVTSPLSLDLNFPKTS